MLVFYLVFSVNVLTEFRPLYFIILPLIWIALDHGLKGVTLGIVVVNFGVMLVMWLVQFNQADIGELQLLMIVNCIIGLLMGAIVTEHKKTEEVLRQSENKFHTLFDQAAVGVAFIETRTGRYLDINQKYCDFLGYTKEEFRNSSFQMFTHPADVQESNEKIALLLSGKINEFSIEKRFIRKDGSFVWANLTASPLWLPGIVPAECVHIAVLLDITERKETEKALKRISNLLEQTGKMAKIGGWEFDVRTGDFFWSPETYRIHDVDPGVTPTKDLVQGFYAPEAKPTLDAMIQSAMEQGTTWEYELPIITASGRAIWIRGQGASIKEDGKTELLYGTYQDITERKKAEENLHETKDYLDNLITYANAPIIIWDSDQKIHRFNLAFTHLTGLPSEEIIGKDLRILFPDETKAESLVKFMQISEGNQLETVEVPILDNKGNTHIVLWNSANIYAKDGKTLVSTIAQGQDITDRKVAEEKILADQVELKKLIAEGERQLQVLLSVVEDQNQARQEIEKLNATLEKRVAERTSQLQISNKELEAFAYSVSHDLRAPLRAIDGYSRILQQECAKNLDDEGLRLLGVVRNSTKTMDQLITDLLSLSRVGRSELKCSTIDMNSLVSAIYQDIATPEVLKKFELKVSNLPNAPADPTLIRQVWVNLISNAIKYTMPKEKGIIEVDGSVQDGVCTYTIKDNGVGFNPDFKNKLFGMFQRLHKAGDFEGTGVGLAIAHRIILRHGGRVSGEGEIGNGATFTFSIPERQVSNE